MTPLVKATALVLVIVGFTLILAALRSCDGSQSARTSDRAPTIITQRDTVRDTIVMPPRYFSRIVTRIERRSRDLVAQVDSVNGDTQLVANPFVASFDTKGAAVDTTGTMLDSVRIRGRVSYPPLALVDVRVDVPPIVTRTIVETQTVEYERGTPWYVEGAKALLWTGLGYGLRAMTEPPREPRDALLYPPIDAPATFKVTLSVPF